MVEKKARNANAHNSVTAVNCPIIVDSDPDNLNVTFLIEFIEKYEQNCQLSEREKSDSTHNRVTLPSMQIKGPVQLDKVLNRGHAVALQPAVCSGRFNKEHTWRQRRRTECIVDIHESIMLNRSQWLCEQARRKRKCEPQPRSHS